MASLPLGGLAGYENLDQFYARVAVLTDLLKASPAAAGSPGVRIPGERRAAEIERRHREGLSYAPAIIQQLREFAERLGRGVAGVKREHDSVA